MPAASNRRMRRGRSVSSEQSTAPKGRTFAPSWRDNRGRAPQSLLQAAGNRVGDGGWRLVVRGNRWLPRTDRLDLHGSEHWLGLGRAPFDAEPWSGRPARRHRWVRCGRSRRRWHRPTPPLGRARWRRGRHGPRAGSRRPHGGTRHEPQTQHRHGDCHTPSVQANAQPIGQRRHPHQQTPQPRAFGLGDR